MNAIRPAVCEIWKTGVHVRTCRFASPLTCVEVSSWSLTTPHIWTQSDQRSWSYRWRGCLRHPLLGTCHVPWQAPADIGVGQIRNLLNGDIEQRGPLVNRSTRSRDISFSKRHGVGSGRAAHTEISPLNHRRTRSALRAPLVIKKLVSIRETKNSFNSCFSCKRLVLSRLQTAGSKSVKPTRRLIPSRLHEYSGSSRQSQWRVPGGGGIGPWPLPWASKVPFRLLKEPLECARRNGLWASTSTLAPSERITDLLRDPLSFQGALFGRLPPPPPGQILDPSLGSPTPGAIPRQISPGLTPSSLRFLWKFVHGVLLGSEDDCYNFRPLRAKLELSWKIFFWFHVAGVTLAGSNS